MTTTITIWQAGWDLHLQSSKVVPGDANARRLRSSSLSLVTWRSWNKMVSRLSPDGPLSLMAGGGEDASPLTGEPATLNTLLGRLITAQNGKLSLSMHVIIQALYINHSTVFTNIKKSNGTTVKYHSYLGQIRTDFTVGSKRLELTAKASVNVT